MSKHQISTFTNDALGHDDASGIAERIASGEITATEAADAAIDRLEKASELNALVAQRFSSARTEAGLHHPATSDSLLTGAPTLIKDNTEIPGLPTRHGSRAIPTQNSRTTGKFARQYLSTGMIPLGKSALPEFGLTATTEFSQSEPCRNPWNLNHSTGGSSGGSAALVAAGAIPIAHANDGGGSIRIPAACCGLVGLKPSRDRYRNDAMAEKLPINLVGEGVVSRSVRDTANFIFEAQKYWRNKKLPAIGHITRPGNERLRIALCVTLHDGASCHPESRASAEAVADKLANLGHSVELIGSPIQSQMADDFFLYWASLAWTLSKLGKVTIDRQFDSQQLEPLTLNLATHCQQNLRKLPGALIRLKRYAKEYDRLFSDFDILLSPTLAHPPPELGYLSPSLGFDEIRDKLHRYATFTPPQNVSGAPAITLPLAQSKAGLPIGIQLASAIGQERRLLELAFELEEAMPWKTLAQA